MTSNLHAAFLSLFSASIGSAPLPAFLATIFQALKQWSKVFDTDFTGALMAEACAIEINPTTPLSSLTLSSGVDKGPL